MPSDPRAVLVKAAYNPKVRQVFKASRPRFALTPCVIDGVPSQFLHLRLTGGKLVSERVLETLNVAAARRHRDVACVDCCNRDFRKDVRQRKRAYPSCMADADRNPAADATQDGVKTDQERQVP